MIHVVNGEATGENIKGHPFKYTNEKEKTQFIFHIPSPWQMTSMPIIKTKLSPVNETALKNILFEACMQYAIADFLCSDTFSDKNNINKVSQLVAMQKNLAF